MDHDQAERICAALEKIATALERGSTLGVEPKGMPVRVSQVRVEHPLDREEREKQFQRNSKVFADIERWKKKNGEG